MSQLRKTEVEDKFRAHSLDIEKQENGNHTIHLEGQGMTGNHTVENVEDVHIKNARTVDTRGFTDKNEVKGDVKVGFNPVDGAECTENTYQDGNTEIFCDGDR